MDSLREELMAQYAELRSRIENTMTSDNIIKSMENEILAGFIDLMHECIGICSDWSIKEPFSNTTVHFLFRETLDYAENKELISAVRNIAQQAENKVRQGYYKTSST